MIVCRLFEFLFVYCLIRCLQLVWLFVVCCCWFSRVLFCCLELVAVCVGVVLCWLMWYYDLFSPNSVARFISILLRVNYLFIICANCVYLVVCLFSCWVWFRVLMFVVVLVLLFCMFVLCWRWLVWVGLQVALLGFCWFVLFRVCCWYYIRYCLPFRCL